MQRPPEKFRGPEIEKPQSNIHRAFRDATGIIHRPEALYEHDHYTHRLCDSVTSVDYRGIERRPVAIAIRGDVNLATHGFGAFNSGTEDYYRGTMLPEIG